MFTIDKVTLEPPVNCSGTNQCVDELTVSIPELGFTTTSCGSQPLMPRTTIVDSELMVEFRSNRVIEDKGFSMLIYCIDRSSIFPQCDNCSVPQELTPHRHKRDSKVSCSSYVLAST